MEGGLVDRACSVMDVAIADLDELRAVRDSLKAQLAEALERSEELEEIVSDLVRNHDEHSVMGCYPGRAAVFKAAWDRAAEAVGLDDGGEA